MEFKTIFLAMTLLVVGSVLYYISYLTDKKDKNNKTIYVDPENISTIRGIEEYLKEQKNENNNRSIEEKEILIVGKENQIVCKALDEITGNKSSINHTFETKNASLGVDCYDKITNTAVDFRSNKHYIYDPKGNGTLLDFYERIFYSNLKANFFEKIGVTYISVPEITLTCYSLGDDNICDEDSTDGVKKLRAQDYIRNTLSDGIVHEPLTSYSQIEVR